jgi:hypothetical protein
LVQLRTSSQSGSTAHATVVPFVDFRMGGRLGGASCNAGTSAPAACERDAPT